MTIQTARILTCWLAICGMLCSIGVAHEHTFELFLAASQVQTETVETPQSAALLEIEILDEKTRLPLHGLIRITKLPSGKPIRLDRNLERPMGWYASPPHAKYMVPCEKLRSKYVMELKPISMRRRSIFPMDMLKASSRLYADSMIRQP